MTTLDELDRLAADVFEGYLVRKDLAQQFRGQYPVPTYVGEFLLGRYCATTDPDEIAEGLAIVERSMKERTVRAGDEELFKSRAREKGKVKIIDLLRARLDARADAYKAELPSLQLTDIHISASQGQLMPLGAVATLRREVEPRTLNRFQQLNAIKLSGVAPRSLDAALRVLEDTAAKILPPGYHFDYTGESRQLRQEGGKFLPAMALALVLIFLVLAAQFNSFRDPFVILAGSVPLAMFGAMIFTFLKFSGPPGLSFKLTEGWTTTLNIYSQVGLVTLVGLVSKNGILIVEFANAQQRLGLGKIEAVHNAAITRLRPILMTTVATVAGHFPLTLVTGPGAVARNSIGIVLVGGMTIGTLFTLFVVPSLYVLIAKDHRKERAATEPAPEEVELVPVEAQVA